jgi:hypothetical protein
LTVAVQAADTGIALTNADAKGLSPSQVRVEAIRAVG